MVLLRAAALLAAFHLTAASAVAQNRPTDPPVASVSIQQVQVAFIGSGALGGGKLSYGGKSYPITVGGLGIGGFGASHHPPDASNAATLPMRRKPDVSVTGCRRSTTVYFGPTKPATAKEGAWVQTTPGKGWFTVVRFFSPLEFDKSWRSIEVALVKRCITRPEKASNEALTNEG